MPNPISTMIKTVSDRRATRRDSRHLEREFAPFRTPNERRELASMFARYPDNQTQEMREVLGRQATRLY